MISRALQVLNGTVTDDTYSDDNRNRTHEGMNDITFIHSFMVLQRNRKDLETFYQGKIVSLCKQCQGFEVRTY